MIVGFTGARSAPPLAQAMALAELIRTEDWDLGVHGDCVGADAVFDAMCLVNGVQRHARPGPDGPYRAYCDAEVVHEQRPYLDRNRTIVDTCDVLVACPGGPERHRSGTWSTIRYARRIGRQLIIVWPDGRVER